MEMFSWIEDQMRTALAERLLGIFVRDFGTLLQTYLL